MNTRPAKSDPEHVYLLVNVNNSFTKLAFSSETTISSIKRVPTSELTVKSLAKAVGTPDFTAAVVASVVPKTKEVVEEFLQGKKVINVSPDLKLGVGIDFPQPATIGADRLANAASAVALIGAPAIVVDFGTAVTFDIISTDRKYIGGVIAPGLQMMTDYLYQRTALLPKIDLAEPETAIGKSTRGAMLAGAVFGYRGLVKEILRKIQEEIGASKDLRIVATGGYAELIASKLPEIQKVYPKLTLEGLRIIGNLNC